MNKKQEDTVLVESATSVALLQIGEAERALAAYLEVDLTADVGVLIDRTNDDMRKSLESALRMGLRLLVIKESCKHGEFEERLTQAGVGLRDAQSCMRLVKTYATEGNARRRDALLGMGKTKAVLLLSAKPEVREQIMESPELLAEALDGSKRDLEAVLKKHEEAMDRHEQAYANLEAQLVTKELELRRATQAGAFTLLTRNIRAEAMANASGVQHCCDDLLRLWHAATESDGAPSADVHLRARTVAMAVSAGLAHVVSLFETLKAEFDDAMPLAPAALDELTDDERQHAIYSAERCKEQMALRRAKGKTEAYVDHVADGGDKKRGRPEGSKTRKGGK